MKTSGTPFVSIRGARFGELEEIMLKSALIYVSGWISAGLSSPIYQRGLLTWIAASNQAYSVLSGIS